jgi:hypothetical protein
MDAADSDNSIANWYTCAITGTRGTAVWQSGGVGGGIQQMQ